MLGLGVSAKPIDRVELASIAKLPSHDESLNHSAKQSCVVNDAVQAKKAPPRANQPSDGAKQPSGTAKKKAAKPSKTCETIYSGIPPDDVTFSKKPKNGPSHIEP
jgi:hypothetical protein